MKKLTYDARKYIQMSIWKLLIVASIFGIFILIMILLGGLKNTVNDCKILLLLLVFFDVIYAGRLYLNHKFYKEHFECKYKDNYLLYSIVKFPGIFESFTLGDKQTEVKVEATRLDRVEKKYGRITIYGKMTMEKNVGRNKAKIIDKFSFPDYCVGEEELMKLVNKQ